jgi:hypothetical protein
MQLKEILYVSGYITQENFILGRTLGELERVLGFQFGRLRAGAAIARLSRIPAPEEFELAAYSNVAEHRFERPADLNLSKLKALVIDNWKSETRTLVKVLPNTPHHPEMNSDQQYPPGLGAPQWKLTSRIPAVVVAILGNYPSQRYVPVP